MPDTPLNLDIVLEGGSDHMKELANDLSDFDVRTYLSPESISTIRGPASPRLEISIDERAIASLVHVILRWWAKRHEEVVVTAADQTFTVKDENSADELLEFVRQGLERRFKPSPSGSGGDWES